MAARRSTGGAQLARLERVLQRFDRLHVLVVGDVILDEYLWGKADRMSPEAPVPVVHVERESAVLGGAANVASNIVALGGRCTLCGLVGDDSAGGRVRGLVEALSIDSAGLVCDDSRPTTRKTRVVAGSQQMLRYDRESDEPLSSKGQRQLFERVIAALAGCSGAIVEDYGKGTVSPRLARRILRACDESGVPVAVDPKRDLKPYRGATLLKPNLAEAEHLSGVELRQGGDTRRMMSRLQKKLPGTDLVITRGAHGMTVCEQGAEPLEVGTESREVFDVQGAGDTTIAALWMARLAGASLTQAAVIANAAAGVVVGKIGTASATRDELRRRLPEAIAAGRPRAAAGGEESR
jgi:rfaE bifunctional protein kinase chain/domain